MTGYGMGFLLASFILLLLLLYHSLKQRRTEDINSRIFGFFIVFGLLDVLFDIISTLLMSGAYPQLASAARMVLTIFYLLQMILPCAMLFYIMTLRNCPRRKLCKEMIVSLIPTACISLLVCYNHISGIFFYFDEMDNYRRGPWYLVTYVYVVLYVLAVLANCTVHRSELEKGKFHVLCEIMLIEIICTVFQAMTGVLTTSLGVALGILVMYLTINNPRSYTDNLTGVFDKKYFRQWMQKQINRKWQVNLIAVELCQLKQVNKIMGTSFGDQLLLQISDQLQKISRFGNVFRTNGDQFVIASRTLAEYEWQRNILRCYFNGSFTVKEEQLCFPAIICGILNAGEIRESDMLQAYIEYLIALAPKTNESILIQGDLRTMEGFRYEQEIERYLNTAIQQDLFDVWYQPVYSLDTGSYITLEALSRLTHPALGPVPAEVFINIAERSGHISQIGILQFRRVCRFVSEHPQLMTKIRNIKFNLSPTELLKSGQSSRLIQVIEEYGLPHHFFQFEITETVATEYSEKLLQVADEFMRAGIGLCLDDFGAGYANLNTVMKLPFSSIKLDRSMLHGICDDPQIASFYRGIVSIFQNLGYKIISEGVERKCEVELLKTWGVDMIQGYYFSRPLPGDVVVKKVMGDDD